jgi:glycosyltransferase involved in cell wall biosynthesis
VSYVATIVVPLLRQVDEWLDQSIRSALAQSVATEVIVIRSELTPTSNLRVLDSLARSHPNLVVMLEDAPGSFAGAINKGIRVARADRIGLLLSDDWLAETAVADSLRESADIVASGNIVYLPDGRVNETASKQASMKAFHSCRTIEQQASYLEHFFLFRKQALLRVGGLDETIGSAPGIDDFDLIWTLLENGASVAIVEKQLYHYRDHDGERLSLQDKGQMLGNLRKILRKHGVPEADTPEIIARHAPWYGRPIYQVMEEGLRPALREPVASGLIGSTAPSPASFGEFGLDLSLDAVVSYASSQGLVCFVTDGDDAGEYRADRSGQGAFYRRTGRIVASTRDSRGRARIKVPFRPFGHFAATDPGCMLGIFWCLDLLRSGYAFAHIPTPLGPRKVSLAGQLARNCLSRLGSRRQPALRQHAALAVRSTLRRVARHRSPCYRPEPGRILLITSTFNRGGSERQMIATAAGLIQRGYDVGIMALGLEPGAPSVEADIRGLGITPRLSLDLATSRTAGFRTPFDRPVASDAGGLPRMFAGRIGGALAAISELRPCVVHGWLDVPAIVSAIAACELGVPRIVIGLRNVTENMEVAKYPPEIVDFLWEGLRRMSANPAVAILNNSAVGAAGYERWLRLPPKTIRLLYNGYMPGHACTPSGGDVARLRAQFGWSPGVPVVGTVMRFVEQKDPDLWLETAAEIAKARSDVRFLLAGYGELHGRLVRRIASLGLVDRVAMPGPVTDAGLIYAALDVILLTSRNEGVPNVLIEAQAAGRPIVAADVGGVSEAVSQDRTGRIVRERSPQRLAEAVVDMLDDPGWAARARTEGPAFVASRFGLDLMVAETLETYGLPAYASG